MANFFNFPANVDSAVGRMINGSGVGVDGGVHLGGGLLQSEIHFPMFGKRKLVAHQGTPRKDRRIRSIIVHGVRPDIRVFEHAISLAHDDIEDLSIKVPYAVRKLSGPGAKEIILVVETRAAEYIGPPHVQFQLAGLGVDVENSTTA